MGKVIKAVAVFITVISIGFSIHGQSNLGFTESDNLNFSFDGALRMPTVGGFTNPQFSEIDLNQDGAQDLFLIEQKTLGAPSFLTLPQAVMTMLLIMSHNSQQT